MPDALARHPDSLLMMFIQMNMRLRYSSAFKDVIVAVPTDAVSVASDAHLPAAATHTQVSKLSSSIGHPAQIKPCCYTTASIASENPGDGSAHRK